MLSRRAARGFDGQERGVGESQVGSGDVEERETVGGAGEEVGSRKRPEEGGDGEVALCFGVDEAEGGKGFWLLWLVLWETKGGVIVVVVVVVKRRGLG